MHHSFPIIQPWQSAKAWAVFLFLLAALLLNTGCAAIIPGISTIDDLPAGTVLFSDDFSRTPTGWGVWDRNGASISYADSGLRIRVDEAQFDYWSVAGKNFSNVTIEADATPKGGSKDNDFGLVCRYLNKDNFYLLVISSDGYYGIARIKNGQYGMIGADQLQYSSLLAQGAETYHLRADCWGSTLGLYVNDQKLTEASDESFSEGDVGVLAGSYDGAGVDILFDNFVVKKP